MLQLAWDYLQRYGELSNRYLLSADGLNVNGPPPSVPCSPPCPVSPWPPPDRSSCASTGRPVN